MTTYKTMARISQYLFVIVIVCVQIPIMIWFENKNYDAVNDSVQEF